MLKSWKFKIEKQNICKRWWNYNKKKISNKNAKSLKINSNKSTLSECMILRIMKYLF